MVSPGFTVLLLETAGAYLPGSGSVAWTSILDQSYPPHSTWDAHDIVRSWPQASAAHRPSTTEQECAVGCCTPLETSHSTHNESICVQCGSMAITLKSE